MTSSRLKPSHSKHSGHPSLTQRFLAGTARLGAISKSFGVTSGGNFGWNQLFGPASQYYAGSEIEWQAAAGNILDNPALSICLGYIFDKVAQPRLQVVEDQDDESETTFPKHPLLPMLRKPNAEYTGRALLQALSLSYKVDGNAYAVAARGASGHGAIRELWYIPHWQMTPDVPEDGGPTQTYSRRVGGKLLKVYDRADVIHFKNGIDPNNNRKGFSRTKALYRSFVSDGEVDSYTAVILMNLGVTLVISPADSKDEFDPDVADKLRDQLKSQMRGDQRGGIIAPSRAVKVERAGSTPQEMALDTIGKRPESRICASMGIIPIAAGLTTGSDSEKYGAFMKEAREASYEGSIVPMLCVMEDGLTEFFLEEGSLSEGQRFQYSYKKVRDLQPDLNEEHKRVRENFLRGLLKRSRAQELIGEKADAAGDGYYPLIYPGKPPAVPTDGVDTVKEDA